MIKSLYKYLIIFLFISFVSCEEKKEESTSQLEDSSESIPTVEKVEYVFASMQGNEDSQAYIAKCSCSIDYIAERMSYEDYVQAQTVMSLRQIDGEKSIMFRHTPNAMEIYDGIQDLIAEAEMECF